MVPGAGARAGTADGIETSEPGLGNFDATLEDGELTPSPLLPRTPRTASALLSPQSQIPHLRV